MSGRGRTAEVGEGGGARSSGSWAGGGEAGGSWAGGGWAGRSWAGGGWAGGAGQAEAKSQQKPKAQLDAEFSELYRAHLRDVYSYAYYRVGNHHDAEDLTEQTFLQAYRHFERAQRRIAGAAVAAVADPDRAQPRRQPLPRPRAQAGDADRRVDHARGAAHDRAAGRGARASWRACSAACSGCRRIGARR